MGFFSLHCDDITSSLICFADSVAILSKSKAIKLLKLVYPKECEEKSTIEILETYRAIEKNGERDN